MRWTASSVAPACANDGNVPNCSPDNLLDGVVMLPAFQGFIVFSSKHDDLIPWLQMDMKLPKEVLLVMCLVMKRSPIESI